LKTFAKYIFLFLIGGMAYYLLEILWRGRSHWTMIFVGGICFLLCGLLNEVFTWEMPLWMQMLICSISITGVEFVAGCVLNLWLHLGIWNYENMPCNVLGQVCLPFTILWFFVSLIAIVLDDWLRYRFFGEERPRYKWG
jgi:uncharacterized membrane protein